MTILGITCQRDDGPFLAEWIAHHFAAGFDRMLVLSHECSDGSDAHLDALAQDPRIQHVPFTPKGAKSVQWQALKHIAQHPWYNEADWALFFDCDEFLCAPKAPLPEMLAKYQSLNGDCDAIALPWRLFGSSGHRHRSDGLTPHRFTQAAPVDLHFPLAHLFKTLHRPDAFHKPGVHRPRAKPSKPARWIGPDGTALPDAFAAQDAAISLYGIPRGADHLCLNHYSVRSEEEFLVKRARGLPNHTSREIGIQYWAERNWNTQKADEIAPMLAATATTLAELMTLPDVAETFAACQNWHSAHYSTLMQDIETLRLQFRLRLLTGSTPPTAQEGQDFMRAQSDLLQQARQSS